MITEWYKNKKILVTGGAGFIGSHIAQRLVSYGSHVTILDNFSTGSEDNITSFNDQITLINGDITDFETCKKATQNQDLIFHLAAFVSVPKSFNNPHQCHTTNSIGTLNLLESARLADVKRFIFSSSCAVYGSSVLEPCKETMPCNPNSPYAYSKLYGELLCKEYAKLFGIQTISLRYFNVFGERQSDTSPYSGVVAQFTKAMKNNTPLIIFGDGSQTRDFVSVEEVVSANVTLGLLPSKELNGQTVNIGTGSPETILDIFNKLKELYRYSQEPSFLPPRKGDTAYSSADCSHYHSLIKTAYITATTI